MHRLLMYAENGDCRRHALLAISGVGKDILVDTSQEYL
jgi:hypothetical protein